MAKSLVSDAASKAGAPPEKVEREDSGDATIWETDHLYIVTSRMFVLTRMVEPTDYPVAYYPCSAKRGH